MIIWTVSNQKGGVGKTTTAVTVGGLLAQQGKRVLLMDLDPQGSLTSYFRLDPDGITYSVYTLFDAKAGAKPIDALDKLLYPTGVNGMTLMPASTAMATLDRQLGARDGMGLVITEALKRLSGQFDYVLMDCPPMLGILMVNALAACEQLLIPVQTEFLALKGLERMLHTLQMIGRSRGGTLAYTIIPTFFDRRTRASTDALRAMRDQHGDHLWTRVIPVDTLFREASRDGIPISLHSPSARGTEAYASLVRWLQTEPVPLAKAAS
ncbi:ParA-like protein [hydrothermal vent metagenome]|uniref:ParA-like protein n=1 Tax=hydrothermal vent metagenome TaxID=652676 RepID=A0A3B0YLL7_9ZZZZ